MDKRKDIASIVSLMRQRDVKTINRLIEKLGDVEDAVETTILDRLQDGAASWCESDDDADVILNTVFYDRDLFTDAMNKKFPNQINW